MLRTRADGNHIIPSFLIIAQYGTACSILALSSLSFYVIFSMTCLERWFVLVIVGAHAISGCLLCLKIALQEKTPSSQIVSGPIPTLSNINASV
ncbi:hypothetical protein BC830DRAFT_1105380 [Chytriomyces sp. MP71]|nr:hypothetical protein BC830DRAFT_1105380 [Chytriomyces sp. MP71]